MLIISRLSYSLFNANYSTRELFLRARRGNIYRGAHLAYLHRTKQKNEIKVSVTNGGIQVVVLLYRMLCGTFSLNPVNMLNVCICQHNILYQYIHLLFGNLCGVFIELELGGRVRCSIFLVEGSNTFMNAKLQQAGDRREAT